MAKKPIEITLKGLVAQADKLGADVAPEVADVAREMSEIFKNNMRLEWRSPRSLQPHDNNPKKHPSVQREAYADLLEEIGWAGAFLYNEQTGRLLDGHMRQQDALERNLDEVPVLVINVDEVTEAKILLFLDKIGTLFQDDKAKVDLLSRGVDDIPGSLKNLLIGNLADDLLPDEGEKGKGAFPEGGLDLVLGESYNYLVVIFKNELDWVAAQDHFGLRHIRCAFSSGVGLGRVVDGGKYLETIYKDKVRRFAEGGSSKGDKDGV